MEKKSLESPVLTCGHKTEKSDLYLIPYLGAHSTESHFSREAMANDRNLKIKKKRAAIFCTEYVHIQVNNNGIKKKKIRKSKTDTYKNLQSLLVKLALL